MTDTSSPSSFQPTLEAVEGTASFRDIPPPVNPLQAQTAFERRARMEDMVAHAIAIIQTSGFFLLAFAALLGFVDLGNAAAATFLGTVMGYAVGKMDPIMSRYYAARIHTAHPATGPPTPETASPASSTPATTGATGG